MNRVIAELKIFAIFKMSKNLYENTNSSVHELEPSDFIRDTKTGLIKVNHPNAHKRHGFVMFYSHTCSHCVDMVETWNALARFIGDSVFVGAFNCKNDSSPFYDAIRKLANVQYYPCIKFMRQNGTMVPYNSGRSKEELLRFLCNETSTFC